MRSPRLPARARRAAHALTPSERRALADMPLSGSDTARLLGVTPRAWAQERIPRAVLWRAQALALHASGLRRVWGSDPVRWQREIDRPWHRCDELSLRQMLAADRQADARLALGIVCRGGRPPLPED